MTGARFSWASISSTGLSRYPGWPNPKPTKPTSPSSFPHPDDRLSAPSPITPDTVINVEPPGDNPGDPPPIQNGGDGCDGDAGGVGNDSPSPSPLPTSLDILWSPEPHPRASTTLDPKNFDLPPPDIFEDVLDNLHVTLHPQTQYRATHVPQDGSERSTVEPTLALYCPIEGGDNVLDETVKELARRVGSDVVVLDCVQLAAGSAGQFGSAANVLCLPNHPLHFQVSSAPSPPLRHLTIHHNQFHTIHTISHPATPKITADRVGSQGISKTQAQSKLKSFFDDLINVTAPPPDADVPIGGSTSLSSSPGKPRIVYVRDFNILATSAGDWYPALLQSVRQRRAGPTTRAASPGLNPTTMVFGVTPPVVPKLRPPGGDSRIGGLQSATDTLTGKRSTSPSEDECVGGTNKSESGSVVGNSEWEEDEASDRARANRLKRRLKKWGKGESLLLADELPALPLTCSPSDDLPSPRGGSPGPDGARGPFDPSSVILDHAIRAHFDPADSCSGSSSSLSSVDKADESVSRNNFFRCSVVVPSRRSLENEKISRMNRRREINELTVRMALSSVGGTLPPLDAPFLGGGPGQSEVDGIQPEERADLVRMWDAWGRVVVVWSTIKKVADRALGSASITKQEYELQSQHQPRSRNIPSFTLDPTTVSWGAVARAFLTKASAVTTRKYWAKETARVGEGGSGEEGTNVDDKRGKVEKVDDVIKRVKRDTDLNEYERRLLECVVDPRILTSTFEQVHLPPHTIDSIQSIVSLPLIHPHAFQHGVLKVHGITGCLLFGPPGTGKTLVVRALAKESRCRMLAVSPSDVMDMYVGEGEKLVKAVFSLARRLSPCVVFIDEIDSLFGARMSSPETGGARAQRAVITEFMSEMDGLRSNSQDKVIVVGATNRPFDLDDAVLRRLPRRLLVDLPGERERKGILRILLTGEQVAEDVDLGEIAKRTGDFSGSDLKHLCVAAALDAVKAGVILPWGATEASTEGTPAGTSHITSVSAGEPGAHISVVENDVDAQPTTTDPVSEPATGAPTSSAPSSTGATTVTAHPRRVISLSNFEKALKEITPSSSESFGTVSKLRQWNDEFGEGKREKQWTNEFSEGKGEKRSVAWGKGTSGTAGQSTHCHICFRRETLQRGSVA